MIFGELLRKPPSDVAVLADFHRRRGLGLAMYSAQNIDRLVTFFRVSPQSDRFLVRHLYTTSVAAVIVQRELPDGAVQHRLPTARRSAVARVWAWLRWGGNSTRPDLRTPGHVPSGTRAVRLAFLIRGDDVLCSLALGKSLYPRSPTSQFLPSGRAGRSNSCRAALG